MIILVDGHPYHYEMENLCRLFYPNEKMIVRREQKESDDPFTVYTAMREEQNGVRLLVRVRHGGILREAETFLPFEIPDSYRERERAMAVLLYHIFVDLTGIRPCWGILTGVRPIKLMRRLLSEVGEEKAKEYFEQKLLVSPQKTRLSLATMEREQKLLALSQGDSYSLYLSIPFCPTRCAYCSFVSQSVERAAKLIPEYVRLLCQELEYTARIAKSLNLRLESVYMGGGTPTTLSAEQMEQVLKVIRRSFDLSSCREFTVEAGRPDTITPEKLRAMKAGGVGRISINPQTLNDHVLEVIGRRHTAEQTIDAFRLARSAGFDHINMDLIAGLPQDSYESFVRTLNGVLALDPESITIHTLAMKKSSALTQHGMELYRKECEETARMLDFAEEILPEKGYHPYYLYRQSRMVGNLENVGWAKKGCDSYYNVYVMDETHTVLACGAGAVTKLKEPDGEYLERIFNFKYPYEYISRFEEMISRKEQVKAFYDQFSK